MQNEEMMIAHELYDENYINDMNTINDMMHSIMCSEDADEDLE